MNWKSLTRNQDMCRPYADLCTRSGIMDGAETSNHMKGKFMWNPGRCKGRRSLGRGKEREKARKFKINRPRVTTKDQTRTGVERIVTI
ncbi:unnamed protein product [Allacma fusca]|uniref:Uncharacterized protein n=1 Tax=Allacma fusca TaxID=39272 RepID=A0A8J2K282_9HEXA|nr:unnamed protein product [Allacma fusca]